MDGVGPEWLEEGNNRGLKIALEPEVLYTNNSYLQVSANYAVNLNPDSGTLCPGRTGIAATTCRHGPLL